MSNIEELRWLAYEGRHHEAIQLAECEVEWLYVIEHSFRGLIVDEVVGDGFGVGHGYRGLLSGTGDGNRRGGLTAHSPGNGNGFIDGSGHGTGLERLPAIHGLLTSAGFNPADFSHISFPAGREPLDSVLQIGELGRMGDE